MGEIHRDDLPMELVSEIEKHFAETHPGMKVVFAGDAPGGVPDHVKNAIDALERRSVESLALGKCFYCGKQMEDYPEEDFPDEWQPPEGWGLVSDIATHKPAGWECPDCDEPGIKAVQVEA